jgi:hypothetical protein
MRSSWTWLNLISTTPCWLLCLRSHKCRGRKVLVVSSGIDTFSKAGIADVLLAERETGVPVCVIDMGPLLRTALLIDSSIGKQPYARLKWEQASAQLSRIANVSGCRASTPESSFEPPAAFDGMLANLRLQYIIRYQATALNLPGTRRVEIAWSGADREKSGLPQNKIGGERKFALAQYELPPAASLASGPSLAWPFLRSSADSIQIPLRDPIGDNRETTVLLASASSPRGAGPGARCAFGVPITRGASRDEHHDYPFKRHGQSCGQTRWQRAWLQGRCGWQRPSSGCWAAPVSTLPPD